MASNTPNLDLYMKDPVIDGNDTFNIKTMMNDNWEKIDKNVVLKESGKGLSTNDYTDAEKAKVQSHENEINNVSNKTATLKPGIQMLTADRTTPFNVSGMKGRTLVNLLGRDGNCEDISKWNGWQASLALDSNKAIGSNAIKVTSTAANAYFNVYKEKTALLLKAGKYYVVLAEARNGTATDQIGISFNPSVSSKQLLKTSDSTAFKTVCSKLAPTVDNQVNIEVGSTATAIGQYFYVDAIRLYEITADEYAALDSMTPEQIAEKYPYVDDVKPVRNPYAIRYGKNLLPSFTEWALHANAKIVTPYKLMLEASGDEQWSTVDIKVIPGQTYTLSMVRNGKVSIHDNDPVKPISLYTEQTNTNGTLTTTFTATATGVIRIHLFNTNGTTGAFTFENPMLNIGDTALPFEPQNNDYVFYDVSLHSNVDGTVRDELFYRDGQPRKLEKFREVVLDGNLSYEVQADKTGFKNITIKGLNSPNIGLIYGVKFDGKILKNVTTSGFDLQDNTYSIGDGNIYITISDTDSGWGEKYQPSEDEIKAYFNGWKMYPPETDKTGTQLYDGTGAKQWMARKKDGSLSLGTTSTINVVPTTLAPTDYTPYRLIYQLAQPVEVPVTSEGKITLHEGTNVLEVGTGVVVREKANVIIGGTRWNAINTDDPTYPNASSSRLSNRVEKILRVYKNANYDANWIIQSDFNPYGKQRAVILKSNYDPNAAYSVTYLVLDRYAFTAPLIDLQGEYAKTVAGVLALEAKNAADVETRVSVAENFMVSLVNKINTGKYNVRISDSGQWEYNDGTGWKGMSVIKSIQRGYASFGTSETRLLEPIYPVNLAKSVLIITGHTTGETSSSRTATEAYARLISSTQIEFIRQTTSPSLVRYGWQVIEYV